jgi:hypothetical protein
LILDNFRIVGFLFFGRIPMDSSHSSLYFDRRANGAERRSGVSPGRGY